MKCFANCFKMTYILFQSESSAPEEFKGVVYSGEAPESDDGMLARSEII